MRQVVPLETSYISQDDIRWFQTGRHPRRKPRCAERSRHGGRCIRDAHEPNAGIHWSDERRGGRTWRVTWT